MLQLESLSVTVKDLVCRNEDPVQTHTHTHTHTPTKYAILGTEIKIQGQLQVRIHSFDH